MAGRARDTTSRRSCPDLRRAREPQQLAERQLSFPSNQEIDAKGWVFVFVCRKAWIVSAGHDAYARLDRADQPDDGKRRATLKSHDRQPDHVGLYCRMRLPTVSWTLRWVRIRSATATW